MSTKRFIVKLTILIFVFVCASETLHAQMKRERLVRRTPHLNLAGYRPPTLLNLLHLDRGSRWHFGFSLSGHMLDFTEITPSGTTVNIPNGGNTIMYADIVSQKVGFNINAVIDYSLFRNLNARLLPGISLGSRELHFFRQDTRAEVFQMSLPASYLELPFLLKYSAIRFTNFRPYIIGGGNIRINLGNKPNEDSQRYIGLSKLEPFVELGFGFDFYLEYFRFSTEIKISKGIKNSLSEDRVKGYQHFRNSLKSMNSNMVVISLLFEG